MIKSRIQVKINSTILWYKTSTHLGFPPVVSVLVSGAVLSFQLNFGAIMDLNSYLFESAITESAITESA